MNEQKPTIGRIVHYTLTEEDAKQINRRRTTGNEAQAGQVYPAMIVRVWGDTPGACFNAQVFLDGNDALWVTSTNVADTPAPRMCHWPPRA